MMGGSWHRQVLEAARSTGAAKLLAERFGGDPSSADWRHFGQLAGFTNPKPERQLPSGLRPFARLRSATGLVYSRAIEFLAGIAKNNGREHVRGGTGAGSTRALSRRKSITPIRCMPAIFTAPIWLGRNMPPAAD
jgi:hypothetical protein